VGDSAGFVLSRHAKRRIAQRGVNLDQIKRALGHPDRTEPDEDDPSVKHAIKRFHRRGGSVVLRVVYNYRTKPHRIVTAFFDRKAL